MEQFNNTVKEWMSYLNNNEYFTAFIALFLIVYASYAAPRLPPYILEMFDNVWVKLILFFLIAYSARKNATVAIISAIALLATLQVLNSYKVNKKMNKVIDQRSNVEYMDTNLELENASSEMIDENAVKGIEQEVKGRNPYVTDEHCLLHKNMHDDPYHTYENIEKDAYTARYHTGTDALDDTCINGYIASNVQHPHARDTSCGYASI